MAFEYIWPPEGGGGSGSPYFIDPVANVGALPASAPEGTLVLVKDIDALYEYRSGAWVLFVDPGEIDARQDTDEQNLADHIADTANPHSVTKAQVGLGNVENAAASTLYVPLTQKGAPSGVATLDAGGLVPVAQLPPAAITDTFVVASEAAQIALTAEIGDVAVRTDINKSFILRVLPASSIGNWQELLTPTDSVLSVNGYTGAVSLSKADVGLGNVDNTSDATKDAALATLSNKTLDEPVLAPKGTSPAASEGKIWYDSTDRVVRYFNESPNLSVPVGQAQLTRINNNTGAGLTPGTVVYITGQVGGLPAVSKSVTTNPITTRVSGVVAETIANGAAGYICTSGLLENVNTSAFAAGSVLYTSGSAGVPATSTGTFAYVVGMCLIQNATTGAILVDPRPRAYPNAGSNNSLLSSDGTTPSWRAPSGNPISVTQTNTTIRWGFDGAYNTNYILNGDFEQTANNATPSGWAQYNDGASAVPVDGTGGTAVGTVTFLASTTTPLTGTVSAVITKDAVNRQGVGYSYAFAPRLSDRGTGQNISLEFTVASGTYNAGDIGVYVYDVTNVALITPETVSIPNGSGKFRTTFFIPANCASARLCLHMTSTNAVAYALKIDMVRIDDQVSTLLGSTLSVVRGATLPAVLASNSTYQLSPTASTTALLPVTALAATIEVTDVNGTCNATNFIGITAGAGNTILYKGVPVTDRFVIRRRNATVRFNKAAGSTVWEVTYQTISVPQGGQLPGSTTGTAIAPGFVGQVLGPTSLTTAGVGSTVVNLGSIALTAGTWLVMMCGRASSATTNNRNVMSISTTSATEDSTFLGVGATGAAASLAVTMHLSRPISTAGQTMYFTGRSLDGASDYNGYAYAYRIG